MFIGHFAVAFASKKVAPKVPLGTLVIAAAFLDAVWPVLVLLGVERFRIVPGFTTMNPFDFVYYPWSHSLVMTAVWAVLFAIVYVCSGLIELLHYFYRGLSRTDVELAACGEHPLRLRPSGLERLTAQELQVATAIVAGATNREAAAELFLSCRTVEHHLGNVYRKLGIHSRMHLVRLMSTPD